MSSSHRAPAVRNARGDARSEGAHGMVLPLGRPRARRGCAAARAVAVRTHEAGGRACVCKRGVHNERSWRARSAIGYFSRVVQVDAGRFARGNRVKCARTGGGVFGHHNAHGPH